MKVVGIVATIFLVLIIVGIAAGPAIVEAVVLRDPAMRADYHRWSDEPVQLTPAANEGKACSKETNAAAARFKEEWHKPRQAPLSEFTRIQLAGGDPTHSDPEFAEYRPLLDAFTAVVSRPDYSMVAFVDRSAHSDPAAIQTLLLGIQSACKLTIADARRLAANEELLAANDRFGLAARAATVSPYDTYIEQMIACSALSMTSTHWSRTIESWSDASAVQDALRRQATIAGRLRFADGSVAPLAVDHLGMIRESKRRGIEITFAEPTQRNLAAIAASSRADFMEQVVLPATPEVSEREILQRSIDSYRKSAAAMGRADGTFAGWLAGQGGRLSLPQLYKIMVPNFEEAVSRFTNAQASFDLLRLATAARLFELENGRPPASQVDLIPTYLPEPLPDRFAEPAAPLPRAVGGPFYSIGPDRTDNKTTITYDPTNGTLSAGDLILNENR